MSTATWGEPEPQIEEQYPLSLIKTLLQQMMRQFGANGAVIALYDEVIGQMAVRLHIRSHNNGSNQAFIHSGVPPEDVPHTGPVARQTGKLRGPSASA